MSEGGDPKRECECESELKVELERDHPSREEVEEASSHEEEDEDEDEGEGGDGSETSTNTSSDNDIVSVADTKLDFSEHHSHHSPHSHHSHHSGEEKAEELTNSFPIKLSANSEDFDSFFCHICYSHRTTQELTEEKDSAFTLSSCGHQYCLTCLQAYLESNILEGHTRIKCCCIADSEVLDDSGDVSNLDINTSDSENKATKIKFCEGFLTKVEVEQILINKIDLKQKFDRFKFLKENPNGRECPECSFLQIHSCQVILLHSLMRWYVSVRCVASSIVFSTPMRIPRASHVKNMSEVLLQLYKQARELFN
jgi:hypothetical protein